MTGVQTCALPICVMSGLHVEVKSDELSEGQEVETFDKSGSDDMNSMPQIMFF